MIKLDYSIESPKERKQLVDKIIADAPLNSLTDKYLEELADYLVLCLTKQEKKSHSVLTDNRLVTIGKRETSYEGLTSKLETGEDGIHGLITNDKNIIFSPNISITAADLEEVPGLKELREAIESIEQQIKNAKGRRALLLKKTLIQMRQDQYVLKNSFRKPIYFLKTFKNLSNLKFDENITLNDKDEVKSDGFINLYDPIHISLLLCNYSKLKEETYDNFNSDLRWLLEDLEHYTDAALKDHYPLYYDLLIYKIDGKTNQEIQSLLKEKYNIEHSVEYLSALWRKKIPKLIAEAASKEWITWYYSTQIYGKWKRCSKCKQIKPAHKYFFTKNNTSKDGFYTICKDCRNKKGKITK